MTSVMCVPCLSGTAPCAVGAPSGQCAAPFGRMCAAWSESADRYLAALSAVRDAHAGDPANGPRRTERAWEQYDRKRAAYLCTHSARCAAHVERSAEAVAAREAHTVACAIVDAFRTLRTHYQRAACLMPRETWWGPRGGAVILDPAEEAARAFQRTAGLALAPLRAEVREALYARSHVHGAPSSSWLWEGFERAEGARSLRRGVRLELSPGARERPMRSWERGALASAYDGVVVRVREPRHGERAARRIAEARGAAVARRWDAAVKAALPAREDGSARPHALDKALATEGAAALLTAALTGALTAPLEPLARAYGAAVVAVRRAQTGLSDAPCEACLAAARTRLVDALLSRAWGHDLTELDAAALAVERARLTELHAVDVRRAEDEARPRAQACRARRERAALAGESDPGCSCAAGITRTTRKGKGSRKGPKVERR